MASRFGIRKATRRRTSDADAVEEWLFLKSACVLFGGKAGELIILRARGPREPIGPRVQQVKRLAKGWGTRCELLWISPARARVVVYDPRRVGEALRKVPRRVLARLGYPPAPQPRAFLREVGRRWRRRGRIPHEIGFALGYPLKDVLGFMGFLPLPFRGLCGWRIYGNPAPSLKRRQEFARARDVAEKVIRMGIPLRPGNLQAPEEPGA